MATKGTDPSKNETLWESQAAFAGENLSIDVLRDVVSWIHADVDTVPWFKDRGLLEADISESRIPVVAYSLHATELRAAVCFRVLRSGEARLLGCKSEPLDTKILASAFQTAIAYATRRNEVAQLTALTSHSGVVSDALRTAGFNDRSMVWHMRLQLTTSSIGRACAQVIETITEWTPRLAKLVLETDAFTKHLGSLGPVRGLRSEVETDTLVLASHLGASDEYPGKFHALILRDGDRDAGVLILKATAELAEVVYLGVKPESRNQGLATSLLTSAIATCKSRGIEEAVVGVEATNIPAQNCYLKCGFKLLEELEVWHYPLRSAAEARGPKK